jgi:outer membrane protein TolC
MNLLKPIASGLLEAIVTLRTHRVKVMLFCATLSSSCTEIPLDYDPSLKSPPPMDPLVDRIYSLSTPSSSSSPSSVNDPVTADTLEAWVAYALAHNAEVTAAFAQYRTAQAQVPQVTALPDPRISYRFFFEQVETRVGPQKFAVGISQPLPWLSKLRLQGAAASQRASAAAARISSVQNRIISEVADAWYELYYFDHGLEIMRGNRDLAVHLERLARTRYGSGAAGHPDVIRAQIELARIEKDLASFTDRASLLLDRRRNSAAGGHQ